MQGRRRDRAPRRAEPRVRRARRAADQHVRARTGCSRRPGEPASTGSCWPRPATRPASTAAATSLLPGRHARPRRHPLRLEQGGDGVARPALPRPIRHGRDLPADRPVVPEPARAARPGDVAVAGRRCPAGRSGDQRAGARASGMVWGISRNTRRWWSLAEGEAIGYGPRTTPRSTPRRSSPSSASRTSPPTPC